MAQGDGRTHVGGRWEDGLRDEQYGGDDHPWRVLEVLTEADARVVLSRSGIGDNSDGCKREAIPPFSELSRVPLRSLRSARTCYLLGGMEGRLVCRCSFRFFLSRFLEPLPFVLGFLPGSAGTTLFSFGK